MAELSNIQELIERTLFESIRVKLVELGYLPDITTFTDNPAGAIAYKAAFDSIIATKGFAIEVFNESSNYDKGSKRVPRIVIEAGSFLPGLLGSDPVKVFEDKGTTFEASTFPTQTADYFLDIHLVSNTVTQERLLNAILAATVSRRKYMPWYDDVAKAFFVENINYRSLDDLDHGIIEKIYSYTMPDCWDRGNEISPVAVAKINEITLIQKIQKYFDNPITESSDTMIINIPN